MGFDFKFKDKSIKELDRFVEEVLDKLNLKSGSRRKQMYKTGNNKTEPKNSYSVCYGYCNIGYLSATKKRVKVEGENNLYETVLLTEFPELKGIFQQLCDLYCHKKIDVNQVHINKNWLSPPHRDKGNENSSFIIGLGDYTGGNLVIERPEEDVEYNIKNNFLEFNGGLYTHYTKPFEGTRYSLVFYNHK